MRRIRPQDRKRDQEPARCSCSHVTDTATWNGKRRSGAGLTGQHGADHLVLNPNGTVGCMHSELAKTTKRVPKAITVQRIRP